MAYGLPGVKDPLDTLTFIVFGVLIAVVGGCVNGYALYILPGLCGGLVYLHSKTNAPDFKRGPSGFGHRSTALLVTEGVDLSGKVAIVTGTTSGIGVETALALAARGAHVILAARNRARLAESRKSIAERLAEMGVQAQLTELLLDLADLESVAEFVRRFKALKLPLHILVNNAGVMALPPSKTKQGFEMQVGVNHLGHFALFSGLLDVLKTSAPSRVVALSSSAIRLADRKFLDHPKLDTVPYYPWGAYGNSKMSNFFFAREANRRFADAGVTVYAAHPGGIHTGLQDNVEFWIQLKWAIVSPFMFKSVEQGAATSCFCATSDKAEAGAIHEDCNVWAAKPESVSQAPDLMYNEAAEKKLWEVSEELVRPYV